MPKKVIFILLILIIIFTFLTYKSKNNNYDFKIHFFGAAKADAILLSKNNHYILIDTGLDSLSSDILNYFKNNNINTIDYLIITHFDKDHVGSASSIIDNFNVNNVLQSNYIKESEYYNNYITSLNNKNIIPITISGNYEILLDDINIVVNGPDIIYDSNESNNSSLIVSVTYNNNNFLFLGDAQSDRLNDYLINDLNTYDFIKMPYHGNYYKSLSNLLDKVSAKYAVMTCDNNEGCNSKTLNLLDDYNITYYKVNDNELNVLSNGYNILIK